MQSVDVYGKTYAVPVDQLIWRPSAYSIVVRDGALLLSKLHGALHLPGGGLNLGELPEAAVIRETREETGIEVANPRLTNMISTFFSYTDMYTKELVHIQSILIYYACDMAGGELSTAGFDAYEKLHGEPAEWLPLEELDDIAAGGNDDWRAIVRQALAGPGAHA